MCKTSVHLLSCLLVLSVVGVTLGDLVGHWKFDEGTGDVANDSSGNNHHGTLLGTPAWTSDRSGAGTAVAFDAATCTGMDCGIFDPTDGKGEFSLALWAYWDGSGTYQHFFTKSNGWGETSMMFQIELWGAHEQPVYADRVGVSYQPAGSVAFSIMPKNEWVHLTWTFDGTDLRVYLNGVDEEGPKPFSIGPNVNATVFIGVDYNEGRVFQGAFDDVRLYSHALTQDEVAELCPPPRTAKDPEPADGAVGITTPLMRWEAGYKGAFHEVYLGTTPDLGPDDLVRPRQPLKMYWHAAGLEPGTTYYWRVDEVEADMTTVNTGEVWSFTMQALTAYLPDPADGSADASTTPTLVWAPGQATTGHHVYFGDSADAVAQGAAGTDKGEQAETAFLPGTLDPVTTYWWRVDEIVAGGEIRTGPVWSFTTSLPVDDFESYTDEEGSRIYETWIDGWTNDTGSTVGYVQAPFAEQTIVHAGLQSMPLDYNNVNPPYYSEAELTWSSPQDWTAGGTEVLVLNVRGLPTNEAAAVYIVLEDSAGRTAVVAHPDDTVYRATDWLEWKIPLTTFSDAGVAVTAVKTMYIGVGDREATAPGGAGILYIDDIRLTMP